MPSVTDTNDNARRGLSDGAPIRRSLTLSQGTKMLARKLSRSSATNRNASTSEASDAAAGPVTRQPQQPQQPQQPLPQHQPRQQQQRRFTISTTPTQPLPSVHMRIVPSIDNPSKCVIFDIVDRELCSGTLFRIGRFAERTQSADCLSFKSKVVSRAHCELWVAMNGKLYLRDTRSSSGTFLNHVRLSPAGQESAATEIRDGDIVQLGVDYLGGEEQVYRSVKMRFELNRAHRPRPLSFSMAQMKNLQTLSRVAQNQASSCQDQVLLSDTTEMLPEKPISQVADPCQVDECCICLYAMAPFQALFVAPCSHTFHFKCIRTLMDSYPGFQCPICRAYADLEASVAMEPEEVLEKYGLRCKSFNPVEVDGPHEQSSVPKAAPATVDSPSQSRHTSSEESESGDNHTQEAREMIFNDGPSTPHASPVSQEATPVDHVVLSHSEAYASGSGSGSGRDRRTVLIADHVDIMTDQPPGSCVSRRPSNFMGKFKMPFFEKKQGSAEPRPFKRSTRARPLSYPNFLMRQFSREEPAHDDASPEQSEQDERVQSFSVCTPSSSSAGARQRELSHHSASLLEIRQESDHQRRPMTVDV